MTVDTIKFSEMVAGGDLPNNSKTPGLLGGANVLFNNPWTFLPPGTTADRPTPSSAINYRLRFNTDDQLYEYYDAVLMQWVQLQENAFTVGPFVTYTADVSLPDAQNLGLLANGILKQTISSAVATLDIAVNEVDYYGPGMTGYLRAPAGIKDIYGNIIVSFFPNNPSDVNYMGIFANEAGSSPGLQALGSDINVGITIIPKGDMGIGFNTKAVSNIPFLIRSGTDGQHQTNFLFANTPNAVSATFQDSNGTVAWLTDIPAGSPSALTKTDDTNVTLTLGGTPSTALLQAVSLTMGWTGTLGVSRGGLGQGTTPSDGQIPVGNSGIYTPTAIASGTGILVANSAGSVSVGLASVATLNLLANLTGGSAAPTAHTLSATIDACIGSNQGNILYRNSTIWTVLAPGTSGQFLQTQGAAANPQWTTSATVVPAALTKTDDTNVTLTLGGAPGTALLQATSLTLGWTGTLSGTRGGTGVNNGASTITLGGSLTTSGAFASTFTMTNTTSVTFPTSGTLATTSQLPTPAALTKVDDTNVTLTFGGTPSTALLQPTSITVGWTGTLSGTRGGTGVNNGASTFTMGGSHVLSGAFTSTFTFTNTTSVTFPTSGTLATTSQIPTGAALTKTDDTNVTLTLGGSPTTALVNAASLTLGWTGQLSVSRGGTGLASATAYGILSGGTTSTGAFQSLTTGASGQLLQSNGSSALPTWVTTTSIAVTSITGTANQVLANATSGSSQIGAITLTTPQDINTTSSPTFSSITIANDGTVHGLTMGLGASSIATNTAFGTSALAANTTGNSQVAIGYQALKVNTTGANNAAIGYQALVANTTGNNNFAFGYAALNAIVTGSNNIGFGNNTLNGTDVSNCIGIGFSANQHCAANDNIAIGTNAGKFTAGANNVLIGSNVATGATFSGGSNVFIGIATAATATTAGNNTCVGQGSGSSLTTGNANAFLGSNTGITTGGATQITTGSNNTLIGVGAGSNDNASTGVISLGYLALAPKATGATNADNGPSIAIGSTSGYVGFRGDNTIYPSASVGGGTLPLTFAGYWRVYVNGTAYKIPLYPD